MLLGHRQNNGTGDHSPCKSLLSVCQAATGIVLIIVCPTYKSNEKIIAPRFVISICLKQEVLPFMSVRAIRVILMITF
jgi:hypothetical protein